MVVEADESDGSFLRLDGTIAVVTNIDPEHLEHYGSFERAKDAYVEFVENVPFYGLAVMCVDHPEVQNILSRIRDRRVVTYGFSTLADIRADNVVVEGGGSRFDAVVLQRDGERRVIEGVHLPMPGRHNVLNALAAIAVGDRARHGRCDDRQRLQPVRRGQAPLQPRRRGRRRDHHRRLCPPSGRNPRRAVGGARSHASRRAEAPASSRSSSRTATRGCNR